MQRGTTIVALLVVASVAVCAAIRGPDEIANGPVKLLLRSPLHTLLSGRLMILTMLDRESGEEFSIPVNYVRSGERVLCGSDFSWWRHLDGGAPVRVLIGPVSHDGWAEIVRDSQRVHSGFRELRPSSYERALQDRAVLVEINLGLDP